MLEPSRNRANGCWKRRTGLERKLILGGVVLTVISLVLAILYFFNEPCAASKDECTSKFCIKAASELLEFVDLKANPCENFYKFVCGSYAKNAVKKNSPTPINTIKQLFENEMKSIIVDPIHKKDSNANVLVKRFYHECMNDTKIEQDKNKAFLNAVNELGGWPLLKGSDWDETKFDWVDWQIKARNLGLPIYEFFTFQRVDSTENDTVIKIERPAGDDKFNLNSKDYETTMKEIMEALGEDNFRADENKEVLAFIRKLRKYQSLRSINDSLQGILKKLLSFTSEEEEEINTVDDLINACPSVPWLKLLNSVAANQTKFDNSSEVTFTAIKHFCNHITKLLSSTKPRVLANYYVWSIIHQTHQFLSRDVRNAYEQTGDSREPRFKLCFREADQRFKYVKETIYIRRRTPRIVKQQLTEMIGIMKEVFKEHLKRCDWMDEPTKAFALSKTDRIDSVIGCSEQLYNETLFDEILGLDNFKFTSDNLFEMVQQKTKKDTQYFFKTLYGPQGENWPAYFKVAAKMNAFFAQFFNLMILPAPILSSIFYDYRKPAFMNYGSIGRVIAHEIMHGFEKSARKIMDANEEVKDWWTNETADAYDKKTKCVVESYERIPFRYRLNGTLTLDENVSDFVSVDVAYETYLRYIQKYGAEKKLPAIPLTPEQIFWVQTGTFLCFRKLDDDNTDLEEEDEHALPTFRVQEGIRNSKYFAKDFNCPAGSFMNPTEKCTVL